MVKYRSRFSGSGSGIVRRVLMHSGYPSDFPCHPLGDAFSQLIQHDAEQPDKHPPGFAWFGSDASRRVGLAIRC